MEGETGWEEEVGERWAGEDVALETEGVGG